MLDVGRIFFRKCEASGREVESFAREKTRGEGEGGGEDSYQYTRRVFKLLMTGYEGDYVWIGKCFT